MSLTVPDVYKTTVLDAICNQTLNLRLFSNNITPSSGSVLGNFTEVAGGGYNSIPLMFGSWVIASGIATYIACNFNFSGSTNAPGTVYGYYITDSFGALVLAERFDPLVVPFSPTGGSLIRVTPRIQVTS